MSKSIAIIPARGGSKRIPGKNIKLFCGKPIISYSINAALESDIFSEVMVSTDNTEIAKIAEANGAKVPFLRSKENSGDFATTSEVLLEVLNTYKVKFNVNFDFGCCLYPTAPFITADILLDSFTILRAKQCDTVFPVISYGYPIWRSFKMEDSNHVKMNWPEYMHSRSQDLPKAYHDAGQFYWFNVDRFLKNQMLFSERAYGFETDELKAQDIDNEIDWKLAELKFKLLNNVE